jgi:hypothetical protein
MEHAGVMGQVSVIANDHIERHCTVIAGTNNTPTVSRVNKGMVSSDGPSACLCHCVCAHQQ